MDIEVNYKNKARYKPTRYPMHQSKFWTGLIWVLSRLMLIGKDRHGKLKCALYDAEQSYAFY